MIDRARRPWTPGPAAALLAAILAAGCSPTDRPSPARPDASPTPSSVAASGPPGSSSPAPSPSPSIAEPSTLEAGRWVEASPAPSRRAEFAAAVLDGRLYVAGGFTALQQGVDLAEVHVYDPAADAWSTVAPLPTATNHPAMLAAAGRLYYLGGPVGGRVSDDTWTYDPTADSWAAGPAMPAPRSQHAAITIGDRIYVVAGVSTRPGAGRETWSFDPVASTWTAGLAAIPTEGNHLAAVAFEGRVWAIGGRVGSNVAAVESYDPAADAWTVETPLADPQGALTAAALGGRIHAVGGEDLDTFQAMDLH
jgi:N-acetylneuraminic acid mutarotase